MRRDEGVFPSSQRKLGSRRFYARARRTRSPLSLGRRPDGAVVIIGLGSDLCNIERIQKSLDRFGERFENRVFTDIERAKGDRRPFTKAGTLAKRFAAKEACAKALGTGFRRGVFFRDMGVVNQRSGKPTLELTGGARARLESITPAGFTAQIDLALTDEWPMAQAFVVITAVPRQVP